MLAYTLHDHVMKFDIGSPFFLVYSFNNMKIPIITHSMKVIQMTTALYKHKNCENNYRDFCKSQKCQENNYISTNYQ